MVPPEPQEVVFGPGADPPEERHFGDIQEEGPPEPSREYTPLRERERMELRRGKRTRTERVPYTPPS